MQQQHKTPDPAPEEATASHSTIAANGKNASKNNGGFVLLSLATLQDIARLNGGYADMAAYIVLCYGANLRQDRRYCSHGAKSVSDRTGMTHRAATKALEWLHQNGFIRPPEPTEPQHLGPKASRSQTVRWVLQGAQELDVAVSKQFVEGVKGSHVAPPLHRLVADVSGADEITRTQAVMDTLLLYAALMKEQDFGDCAGVDPGAWHMPFEPIANHEDGGGSAHVVRVPGTDAVLITVKEARSGLFPSRFAYEVFGETPDNPDAPQDPARHDHVVARFRHALAQLRALRLVYRVLVLWHGNPLDPAQRRRAEPVATHYINDAWARQIDPHLQDEVHRAAWRSRARSGYMDHLDAQESGKLPFTGSGRYRYIVPEVAQKNMALIGQLRVRYWPANPSTVGGRGMEQRRTERYVQMMENIGKPQSL